MGLRSVERRLRQVGKQLQSLRDELRILDEQRQHLRHDAEEARIQSLVSETPLADRAHREASRHAEVIEARHSELIAEVQTLEAQQDSLLDELTAR